MRVAPAACRFDLISMGICVMATMKAAVIHEPGGPEVLKLETRPVPVPKRGEVLIRVKAFGLNRSELFTRIGKGVGAQLIPVSGYYDSDGTNAMLSQPAHLGIDGVLEIPANRLPGF